VRKIDELGVDTTVRGAKVVVDESFGDTKLSATLLGGQLNPCASTRRPAASSPPQARRCFFGFPQSSDFEYYASPGATVTSLEPGRPSYLEDTVVGARVEAGLKVVELGLNAVMLGPRGEQRRSAALPGRRASPRCRMPGRIPFVWHARGLARARPHPQPLGQRPHSPIEDVIDAYVEVAGQQQLAGRAVAVDDAGEVTAREPDLSGYAVYANVNVGYGPLSATLEAKHYRSFFPLGANVDVATPGFAAPEFGVVSYSQPPTAESIYVEPIALPTCATRAGAGGSTGARTSRCCSTAGSATSGASPRSTHPIANARPPMRCGPTPGTMAVGTELNAPEGKSHTWAWIGARFTIGRARPRQQRDPGGERRLLPRGLRSLRLEPGAMGATVAELAGLPSTPLRADRPRRAVARSENYLALNWNPHMAFIFGYEYQTRPGFPSHYFSGSIQYRSKSNETVWDQLFDTVRLFVGQRRAAMALRGRQLPSVSRVRGGRVEMVSRF